MTTNTEYQETKKSAKSVMTPQARWRWVMDQNYLTPEEKDILHELAYHANSVDFLVWVSIQNISERQGRDYKSCLKACRSLRDMGLITDTRVKRGETKNTTVHSVNFFVSRACYPATNKSEIRRLRSLKGVVDHTLMPRGKGVDVNTLLALTKGITLGDVGNYADSGENPVCGFAKGVETDPEGCDFRSQRVSREIPKGVQQDTQIGKNRDEQGGSGENGHFADAQSAPLVTFPMHLSWELFKQKVPDDAICAYLRSRSPNVNSTDDALEVLMYFEDYVIHSCEGKVRKKRDAQNSFTQQHWLDRLVGFADSPPCAEMRGTG